MSRKRIAIACQGGGLHAAFTAGVLRTILTRLEQDQKKTFEIAGLSGTSAGALNAFMVWYGLLTGGPAPAIDRLNGLWHDFAARLPAEQFFNSWVVNTFRLQGRGMLPEVKFSPYSPYFSLLEKQLEFSEFVGIRPEFVDYEELLARNAPRLEEIKQAGSQPRLLIGAVEVLSGAFKAFDSQENEISFEAVRASGAIPWWGLKAIIVAGGVYWDGLLSQNPPIKNFLSGASGAEKPDEIWVVRINPQTRLEEPQSPEDIEDRRNELAGNLSLNQELDFIRTVNKWLENDTIAQSEAFKNYKHIAVREVAMSPDISAGLDAASKLDRSPAFIEKLMADGEKQAEGLLQDAVGNQE